MIEPAIVAGPLERVALTHACAAACWNGEYDESTRTVISDPL